MKAHLVGGGIASLAAAVHLIRDAGMLGANIHIYEARDRLGGCLVAGGLLTRAISSPAAGCLSRSTAVHWNCFR